MRLAFTLALYVWLRRSSPWLSLGHSLARRDEVRRLVKPAFAFMLMPISQALLVQGPIMILGALMSPVAVVTFATTRTLTRVGTAATNMLNGSLQGEYGVAFGRHDSTMLRKLLIYHQLTSFAAIAIYAVLLNFLKHPLMQLYTHGKIPAHDPFFILMILTIAAEMMWSSIATPLSSINRHVAFAYLSMLVAALGMGLCYLLTYRFDLIGTVSAMLTIHLVILAVGFSLRGNLTIQGTMFAKT